MRPSQVLDLKHNAVRESISRIRVANLRVFGSVLRGTAHDGSDLINLDVVWETVQTVLPELLKQLPTMCENANNEDRS